MKKYVILVMAFFAVALTTVTAQKFATHTVKEGETLQSISRQYRVTPFTIIQSNKEIKTAEDIRPNTILIIPLDGKTVKQEETKEEVEEQEEKPLGFSRHRVRKRETLYGLTERYKITEEQLKRYNRQLYSEPLKKGMVLQIPKYPIPDPNEEKELDFEVYTVQPKETRWSIAHKYGISVDSLVVLNPELATSSDYLAIGQELKLPRPKGDSLENQKIDLYTSYTVPSKQTLYSLGREYGIPSDSILKLNPEVVQQGGLKEGMVLRLPKKKNLSGEVNTENFIFYEVKPKQNIFRLTQNLNISRDELFSLNPALENGLKAGMVLKLPKNKSEGLEVKNALILDKVNLQDSIKFQDPLNVVFMLPFRLDRINLNDKKKTEGQIKTRRDLALSLGFYSGAMVALDSIKQLGVSVNVKTFDTQLSQTKVKEILLRENLYGTSAVIGPIASSALDEVAVQAASQNIPVISPTASKSALGHKNVFYSVPKEEILRAKMLSYLNKIHKNENVIIVADSSHTAAHDTILSMFPAAQIARVIDNKSLHLDRFLIQLSEEKENWVFLETDQANMVSSVSSILNSANTEEIKVRMFTTSFNNAFENNAVSKTHLSNLKFSYPSFYKEGDNDAFTKAYRKRFRGVKPDRYATRGFDLTFDILLKLAHKNNLFETSKIVGSTEYSGNSFDYYKDWSSGYHNHAGYIMEYDSLQIKQVQLDDLKSNL
nr:LysM peptidoglycan-binding domain-containing protein [uncultured Allomuricauda sp.]